VAGVRSNFHLYDVGISLEPGFQIEIDFYLGLNKLGRYLLRSDQPVVHGVWCLILAKCQDNGMVYYYLRELPTLIRKANRTRGTGKRRRE
jgi:hypothetical protein